MVNDYKPGSLFIKAIDLLKIANEKGFTLVDSVERIKVKNKATLPYEKIYFVQILALIQWWLKDIKSIMVWVEPLNDNTCCYLYKDCNGIHIGSTIKKGFPNYEIALLNGLLAVINELPPSPLIKTPGEDK